MEDPKACANVFFIGLMGAGKTTVGRAVAKRLDRPFYDSDHEIEARTGVKIPLIFEHEGEAGFRARESLVIDDLSQRSGIVLATGGGAVLAPQNREWLNRRGSSSICARIPTICGCARAATRTGRCCRRTTRARSSNPSTRSAIRSIAKPRISRSRPAGRRSMPSSTWAHAARGRGALDSAFAGVLDTGRPRRMSIPAGWVIMSRMITVTVDLGQRAYPIHIGPALIDRADLFAPHVRGSSIAVVTNETVAPLYADRLEAALAPLGKTVIRVVLPDGEVYKHGKP